MSKMKPAVSDQVNENYSLDQSVIFEFIKYEYLEEVNPRNKGKNRPVTSFIDFLAKNGKSNEFQRLQTYISKSEHGKAKSKVKKSN